MAYQGNYPPSTPLTSSQIAAGAVQPSNLSSIGPSWDGSGNLSVLGSSGSSSNRLSFTYNGSSGEATVGPNSTGGTTFLTFGTSSSGTYSERMRIDSSGNVGIGTSSPSYSLHVNRTDAAAQMAVQTNTTAAYVYALYGSTVNTALISDATTSYLSAETNNAFVFRTNATERARITSGGNFGVGTSAPGSKIESSQSINGVWNISATNTTASGQLLGILTQFTGYAPNNTTSYFYYAVDTSAVRFAVYANGGVLNYQANNGNLSDFRLKKNITLAGNYLDKICAIPVKTFLYKDQTDDDLNLGVIAQDVEAVAPELVDSVEFGQAPEDGVLYKAIYQTDLQYALMKCIQELKAELDAAKARIAALEGVAP
jgi:hypothetical protein